MLTYSIWLRLPPELELFCQNLQNSISRTLSGPTFVPHLTIAGGVRTPPAELKQLCKSNHLRFISHEIPIKVQVIGYEIDTPFFQSLFIRCSVGAELKKFRRNIYEFSGEAEPEFIPHISLYYGRAQAVEKNSIIKSLPDFVSSFDSNVFSIASNEEKLLKWEVIEDITI